MSIVEIKITLKSFLSFNFVHAGVIALVIFSILCFILKKREEQVGQVISKKDVVIVFIQSIYIAMLIGGTLLDRPIELEHQMELTPFWSYRECFKDGNLALLVQMIFNVLVFIPCPILFAHVFPALRRFRWAVGSAFVFSACIEVTQLVFKLGLFEFDDMFHNTLGAVIGYSILKLYKMHKQKGIEE